MFLGQLNNRLDEEWFGKDNIFEENGVLKYMIGVTASSDDGKYIVDGNIVKIGVPSDTNSLNWSTLLYVPEDDILIEKSDDEITTYVRIENDIIKTGSPWGFAGSSLQKIILYANGDAYCITYDGEGFDEKNIVDKTLIAKNVEDIESNEETEGDVILKGKNIEEIENMDWTKFQK